MNFNFRKTKKGAFTAKGLLLKIRFIYLGIKNIFGLNLLDHVKYKNVEYYLNQGVNAPYWDLVTLDNLKYVKRINESQFKKIYDFKTIIRNIIDTYDFFMMYWFDIFYDKTPFIKCIYVHYNNYRDLMKTTKD
jgi:hypothetical protein